MLWQALTAVRDLGRLHDIAAILIRYGFGDMVRRMGLANALERVGQALHWNEAEELAHLEPPARVRRALEDMGPTFVKLGQVLATRVDLFEPEWIAEFSKLQDHAPAVPYADIRQQLTEDLGASPEEVFAAFNPESLAAGFDQHHGNPHHANPPWHRPAGYHDPAATRPHPFSGIRPRRGNHRDRLPQRGRTTGPLDKNAST